MPKRRCRSFTPQFTARVVLEVLSGLRSQAEVARQHKLKPELIARWKDMAPQLVSIREEPNRAGGASTDFE
jgi:transposase-like protein